MSKNLNSIHISLNLRDIRAHLFDVTLSLNTASPKQRFSLPVWTPGSYMVREFAQHIVSIKATDNDEVISLKKISKNCFEINNTGPNLTLNYQVYAFDSSIRAAYLDDQQAYFNGTSLFLRPHGHDDQLFFLTVNRPHDPCCEKWRVATGMEPKDTDERGFGLYTAQGYEALVDYPFQISEMERVFFTAAETPHEMAIVGDFRSFDSGRLESDLKKICEQHVAIFDKKPPFERYVFIARFEEGGAGGLEHRNSTMLISPPHCLPKIGQQEIDQHYRQFLGLCSHEYFHAWNVKRLLPKEFVPFNFDQECYTTMLWIFEGITSYYDDLALRTTGLISPVQYLEILSKNYSRLLKTRGRMVQTLAEASYDAWIKFYRQNENSPNATISYYLKGSFVALMLDLIIRINSQGEHSLDNIMQKAFELYKHGITEENFFQLLSDIGGVNIEDFKNRYIYGLEELPIEGYFARFGIEVSRAPDEYSVDEKTKMLAYLGMKIRFDDHNRAFVTFVEQDGPAMNAGLSPHDEIIAVDNIRLDHGNVSDLMGGMKQEVPVSILTSRKKMLRNLVLIPKSLPWTIAKFSLKPQATALESNLREKWLKIPGSNS